MAIAPTKLGQLILGHKESDDALVQRLRALGLVTNDASDEDLRATFRKAREEHAALPHGQQPYNSPHERVRVFLKPFLTGKGDSWAVPVHSLKLLDDDGQHAQPYKRSRWWQFWR